MSKSKTNIAVISASDTTRQHILSEATEDFLDIYAKIQKQLANEVGDIIQSRHKIGCWLTGMINPNGKKNYGTKCVERMADVLGTDRNIVYNSMRLYERYPAEDLAKLIAARNQAGHALTWTHVVHLVQIPDNTTRIEMQQVALDGNLTAAELLAYIQKKSGAAKKSNGGRPMARPRSLDGFIENQKTVLNQLIERKTKVWAGTTRSDEKSFFDVIHDTPADRITEKTLTEMKDLETLYAQASVELDSMSTELLRTRKTIEQARKATPKLFDVPEDMDELDTTPHVLSMSDNLVEV